jgi:UDPglucose--hexose-1-phosphate uridylyltransferase
VDLRVDPLSGRLVAIAPGRARRPGASSARLEPETAEELETCPFCEGRENRTPPEVLALPAEGRAPEMPGWQVRVVPNKFPALEHQEVVVHSPRHVRTLADLDADQLRLVAEAWQARATAARAEGYPHVFACINEGRAAGASLLHSHSQLVWLREPPPEVARERRDGLVELLDTAVESGTVVGRSEGLIAFCHPAGRLPYETVIASDSNREPWPDTDTLAAALVLLGDVVQRLRSVEGAVPWNAWLHHGHDWHLVLVPRLTVVAGLELGAGLYVNAVPPEEAAERLRTAS